MYPILTSIRVGVGGNARTGVQVKAKRHHRLCCKITSVLRRGVCILLVRIQDCWKVEVAAVTHNLSAPRA
eukprot:1159441-Pelagomonas_calceolata.AAC.2